VTDLVDLCVVGGGPAGAAAAITGARAGQSVTLVDKAVFPRDKTCGDGLTASALRWLERLGLDPGAVESWTVVHETVVVAPSGRAVAFPLPSGGQYAAVATRVDLDAGLVDVARTAGVVVAEGDGVAAVDTTADDRVSLTLASGTTVRARFVVAADGMYSTVRRLTTPLASPSTTTSSRPYLGEMHAFRQYFHGVDDERLWVLFEEDLLPGYAWVFPLGGGRANVGFGVHRAAGQSVQPMKEQWRSILDRPSLRSVLNGATPEAAHRAWPIPAGLTRGALARGRVLFVGDAAAATDPMTGEGIAQALETGVLAARAVIECGGDVGATSAVGTRYAADVERALGRDLRFARALLAVLRSPRGARAAVRIAGASDWTRRNFARWLFEDYPRALVLTPSRWKRGAMRGTGAYR